MRQCPRSFLALAGLLLIAASPSWAARDEPWESPPFSADPQALRAAAQALPTPRGAGAEVLLVETEVHLDAAGVHYQRERLVFRLLAPQALEEWSTSEVDWSPWYEERPEIRARVMGPDGSVRELDPRTVAEAPAESGDPGLLTDHRVLRAPLPALEVGAVVESQITVRRRAPYFEAGESRRQWLATTAPVRRARVILEAPEGLPLRWVSRQLRRPQPRRSVSGGRQRLVFEEEDIPAIWSLEPGLPPDAPRAPYVAYSTGATWESVAGAYSTVVDRQIAGADLTALTSTTPAPPPGESDWKQMRDLLRTLHREVRYTGVSFGEAGIIPRSPGETLKRRFGDCKDKAALLVALFRRSGIPAYLALLTAGYGPDVEPELPGLGLFDHALVVVPGAVPLWIDPTVPYLRLGELPSEVQGRWVLIASPNTTGLVRLPESGPEGNRVEELRELTLAKLGGARVRETSRFLGAPARRLRESWADTPRPEIRQWLEGYVASTYQARTLLGFDFTLPEDLERPFELRIQAENAGFAVTDLAEGVVVMPLAGLFQSLPEPLLDASSGPRHSDYLLPYPFETEWRYRFAIPDGLKVRRLPEGVERHMGPAIFRSSFTQETAGDGRQRVEAVFDFSTGARRLSAQDVNALRQGLRQLEESDGLTQLLWLDQTVSLHLAAGEVAAAVEEAQRLHREDPGEPLHRAQLARALLAGGLGREARQEAREAVEGAPSSLVALQSLAWTLIHDQLGRSFATLPSGRGFDREQALQVYRKALEVDPANGDLRAELAILLEHDARGRRYAPGADLKEAIEEYRRSQAELQGSEIEDNLLVALLWAERLKELREELARRPPSEQRTVLSLVVTAALDGPEPAAREANRTIPDPGRRVASLAAAAQQLMLLRRYREASGLFRVASRGAENPESLLTLADLLERTRTYESLPAGDSTPAAAVRRLFLVVLGEAEPSMASYLSLMAPSVRGYLESRRLEETSEILGRLRKTFLTGETPRVVLTDLALASLEEQVDGSDLDGYRVHLRSSIATGGHEQTFFVVRDGGAYRLVSSSESPSLLAYEARARLDRGDAEGARRWLAWAAGSEPSRAGGGDPLAGPLLRRFLRPGEPAEGPRLELAIAALAAEGSPDERTLRTLESARSPEAPGRQGISQADVELALALGRRQLEDWPGLKASARRLLELAPASPTAFRLASQALEHLGEDSELIALARQRQQLQPGDPLARRALARAAARSGDLAASLGYLREILDSGRAAAEDYRAAALTALQLGRGDDEALGWARRAAEISRYRSGDALRTVAALYAEGRRPVEAHQVLLQAVEASGDGLGDWDRYLLGRLAELYGLPGAAADYYGSLERPREASQIPLSPWSLSRHRLDLLQRTSGAPVP